MELSGHYRAFENPTLIALTNHDLARFLRAHGRTVEEVGSLGPVTISDDKDRLTALYLGVQEWLQSNGTNGERFFLCAPEINRTHLEGSLTDEVRCRVEQVVFKNLATMDLNHVMRILLEG